MVNEGRSPVAIDRDPRCNSPNPVRFEGTASGQNSL
jgi:hypothetical protein